MLLQFLQLVRLEAARELLMLEFLEQNVSLLVVTAIFGRLLRNVHLVVVQLALQVLQNELLPVVLVLQSFILGLEILNLLNGIYAVLFDDLVLQKNITLQYVVVPAHFLNLLVQRVILIVELLDHC